MTSRLIYFIPSPANADAAELIVSRGLGDRFCDCDGRLAPLLDPDTAIVPGDLLPFAQTPVKRGPDGGEGVLVSIPQGEGVRFDADAQTWVRFDRPAPGGTIWLGWWNDARPGPDSIQRAVTLPGYGVLLGDGNTWVVPVAKLLPASRVWDGKSWLTRQRPVYAALWNLSCDLLREFWEPVNTWAEMIERHQQRDDKSAVAIPADEEARATAVLSEYEAATAGYDPMDTVRILSANYRIGPEEVSALELIDAGATIGHDWAVANALVDGQRILLDRAKKNGPAAG